MNQSLVLNCFRSRSREARSLHYLFFFKALVTSGIFPCLWFNKKRAKYAVVNDISIKKEGCGRSGLTNLFGDFGPAKQPPQQRGWPPLSPACPLYMLSSKDCCSPWVGSPGESPWALLQSL